MSLLPHFSGRADSGRHTGRARVGASIGAVVATLALVPGVAGAATSKTKVTSTSTSFTDGFSTIPAGTTLTPGTRYGNWMPAWNGFGSITRVTDGQAALQLEPETATTPGETHSALVTSVPSFGNTDLTMSVRTVSQLRQGSAPNPWEVGWALWHYTDNSHFYYLALKPNGWELGKEDPAYPGNQRFLATGGRSFAVGSWHQIHVTQIAGTVTVSADGLVLTTFVDGERPYLSGSIGLYCEDSLVHFAGISATGRL